MDLLLESRGFPDRIPDRKASILAAGKRAKGWKAGEQVKRVTTRAGEVRDEKRRRKKKEIEGRAREEGSRWEEPASANAGSRFVTVRQLG